MSQIGHNYSNAPKTLAWEPLDSLHVLACPRMSVEKAVKRGYLAGKGKWLRQLETNHLIAACCRNPVKNADIEAWYSCPDDAEKKTPDIYKFYCRECERAHVFFCVGGNHPLAKKFTVQERPELFDRRPFWEVR